MSYPVTRHTGKPWGSQRLPNSLRFKARLAGDGRLVGVIFHVPRQPPAAFRPEPRRVEAVWRPVHGWLNDSGLERLSG